jgi:hypothetical protein
MHIYVYTHIDTDRRQTQTEDRHRQKSDTDRRQTQTEDRHRHSIHRYDSHNCNSYSVERACIYTIRHIHARIDTYIDNKGLHTSS